MGKAEDIIEDIWAEVQNFNTLVTRNPLQVLSNIEEICMGWGENG